MSQGSSNQCDLQPDFQTGARAATTRPARIDGRRCRANRRPNPINPTQLYLCRNSTLTPHAKLYGARRSASRSARRSAHRTMIGIIATEPSHLSAITSSNRGKDPGHHTPQVAGERLAELVYFILRKRCCLAHTYKKRCRSMILSGRCSHVLRGEDKNSPAGSRTLVTRGHDGKRDATHS